MNLTNDVELFILAMGKVFPVVHIALDNDEAIADRKAHPNRIVVCWDRKTDLEFIAPQYGSIMRSDRVAFPPDSDEYEDAPYKLSWGTKIYCLSMGMLFRLRYIAKSVDEANECCNMRTGCGVICQWKKRGLVFVADLKEAHIPKIVINVLKGVANEDA